MKTIDNRYLLFTCNCFSYIDYYTELTKKDFQIHFIPTNYITFKSSMHKNI